MLLTLGNHPKTPFSPPGAQIQRIRSVENHGPRPAACERGPVRRWRTELGLGPATRLLWRSVDAVHLELGSRAVLVEGLEPEVVRHVATSGRRGAAPPIDEPSRRALRALTEAGYLWPRAEDPGDDDRLAPPAPRLATELAALSARHGQRAAELLNARHHATVSVYGSSRAAVHVAALLAAAGVGRVHCAVPGDARLCHAVPGGITPADEGRNLAAAADSAVRRAAPDVNTTPMPFGEPPDLTVLALDGPVDDDRRDALHAAGAAHLLVRLGADFGVVGPLVVPGLTSCLRCADRHRRDRDPAWSALAVQLGTTRRHGPVSDVAVATIVAGVAALQALTLLDGGDPAAIDGTLELRLPDWRIRRRSWPPHPECDCANGP
jgi:hypothetical protein